MPTARLVFIACLILSFPTSRAAGQEGDHEGKNLKVLLVAPKAPVDEADYQHGSLPFTAADAIQVMLGVAAGTVTERQFAEWLRERRVP